MFTINIKGKANPKDLKMVKLEMIIFKTGCAWVTKVLNISGPVKEWDNQAQSFKGNGSTLTAKNKILFELKNQYQKVAKAAKNGNTGDVSGKLRKLKAVCLYAKEQGMYNVNLNAFGSFKEKLKHRITTLKGVSPEVMQQIESFDRMLLTKKE